MLDSFSQICKITFFELNQDWEKPRASDYLRWILGNCTSTYHFIAKYSVGNYVYDKLGQLTKDNSEGIAVYTWRMGDKKLKSITRDGGDLNSSNVDFVYNPFGQRVLKIVKPRSGGVISHQADWEYSYYTYDANGQVMAVYDLENPLQTAGKALLTEEHLYGVSRLGMIQGAKVVYNGGVLLTKDGPVYQNAAGARAYEITNHLGNVNAVITDRKMPLTGGIGALYEAVSIQTTDYYPFGMTMPGRGEANYRYAYNGMEVDNEIKGNGSSINYKYRMYDPRLGRFFQQDPLTSSYPELTPYQFASNSPIYLIEIEGLEGGPFQEGMIDAMQSDICQFGFGLEDPAEVYPNNLIYQKQYAEGQLAGHIIALFASGAEIGMGEGGLVIAGGIAVQLEAGPLLVITETAAAVVAVASGIMIAKGVYDAATAGKGIILSAKKVSAINNQIAKEKKQKEIKQKSTQTNSKGAPQKSTDKKMLGQNGPKIQSKTMWKNKNSSERIDVENPSPGKRPGQVHYQDAKGNKHMYNPEKGKFYMKDKKTGKYEVESPKGVQDKLKDKDIKEGVEKGVKYLEGK